LKQRRGSLALHPALTVETETGRSLARGLKPNVKTPDRQFG